MAEENIVKRVYKKLLAKLKPNNNLSKIKETMSEKKPIQETATEMPALSGPIYNMIKADKFDVMFTRDTSDIGGYEFIPHNISLAEYHYDINGLSENKLYLDTEIVKRKTYFGKPTEITNIFLNRDIIDFINEFNGAQPRSLIVREYTNNNQPIMETTYYYPHITAANLCKLSTTAEGQYKAIRLTITFDSMENVYCK